jgi:alkylation response protein AidB-like acyl-CoA dehydrogenase
MAAYQAPLRDLVFNVREIADLDAVGKLPGYEDAPDMLEPILEEAANFAAKVLDPINATGDREGSHFDNGAVTTPKGFKEAFNQFAAAGWIGLPMPTEYGGQGLPQLLGTAALEMWQSANMAFSNGPLLNQGAIEALLLCGSDEQKQTFIPKLVSGEWTGTMDLTEPQAGSDLAQVKTKAVPNGDHYLISGQKIFITYGEHDYTENIVHLVLARTPSAPDGVKGISLFVVPKRKINADGSLGELNDVTCAGIEHKMGIHASPTCTMNYGEKGGAVGYLLGEENQGLKYMFIMMNAARFSVGVQGYAIADRAYQAALTYARDRVQSKDIAAKEWTPVRIIEHPDVRRMLMNIKSQIEAMRSFGFFTAAQLDHAHANTDEKAKATALSMVELFTPIVKAWSTEVSQQLVSEALQIFGGMGFVEETGVAQYYRDVRITQIYEGTTGIQSNDLMGRKFLKDNGKTAMLVIGQMQATLKELQASENEHSKVVAAQFAAAIQALAQTSQWLGGEGMKALAGKGDVRTMFAGAVPYLMLWGYVCGGWMMAKSALIAEAKAEDPFYATKLVTARFYAEHVLPKTSSLAFEVQNGGATTMAYTEEQFDLERKGLALV